MDNFEESTKAINMQLDAQGSAMRENDKYLASFEGRMQTLKVAMEGVYNNAINSEMLKKLITVLEVLVTNFANLHTVIVVAGLALSIFLAKKNISIMKSFGAGLQNVGDGFRNFGTKVTTATVGMNSFKTAMVGARIGITSLKTALGPIGLALIAFEAIMLGMRYFGGEQKDVTESLQESNKEFKKQNDNLTLLTDKYVQNFEMAKKNNDIKQKLTRTVMELEKALGKNIEGLDLENKSLEENTRLIIIARNEKSKKIIADNQINADLAKQEKEKKRDLVKEFYQADESPYGATQIGETNKLEFALGLIRKEGLASVRNTSLTYEEMVVHLNKLLDNKKELLKLDYVDLEVMGNVLNTRDAITKKIDLQNDILETQKRLVRESYEDDIRIHDVKNKLNKSQQEMLDNLKGTIKLQDDPEKYISSMVKLIELLSDFDGTGVRDVAESVKEIAGQDVDIKSVIKQLLTFNEALGGNVDVGRLLEKSLGSLSDKAGTLSKAYEEMDESKQLSISTVQQLLKDYPELIEQLEIEGDITKINKDLLVDKFNTLKDLEVKTLVIAKTRINNLRTTSLEAAGLIRGEIYTVEQLTKTYEDMIRTKVMATGVVEKAMFSQGFLGFEAVGIGEIDAESWKTGFLKPTKDTEERAKNAFDEKADELKKSDEQLRAYLDNVLKAPSRLENVDKAIELIRSGGLKDYGSTKDKKDKTTFKPPEDIKNEVDAFADLNRELEDLNDSISRNNTLQGKSTLTDREKVRFQTKEIELLKEKKKIIDKLSEAYETQTGIAKKTLGAKGVEVDEDKNIIESTFNKARQALVNKFNTLKGEKQDDDRAKVTKDIKALDDAKSKYDQLTKGLADSESESADIQVDIVNKREQRKLKVIEDTFKIRDQILKENEGKLKDLEHAISITSDQEKKNKLIAQSVELHSKAIGDLVADYLRLEAVTDDNYRSTDLFQDRISDLKDKIQGLQSSLKSMTEESASSRVENVKKVQNIVENIIKEGVKQRKEALDEELDIYSEHMDKIIEEKQREFEELDYETELRKELDDKQEIQNKINILSLDNSFQSYQKRLALEKDLAEQEEKIKETTTKRGRTLEIRSLKESKDIREKDFEDEKNEIDKTWTDKKIKLTAQNILINKNFDEIKGLFPELFDQISTEFQDFNTDIITFETTFGGSIGRMVADVRDDLLPEIKKATEDINKLKDLEKEIKSGQAFKDAFENDPRVKKERAKEDIGRIQTEWNKIDKIMQELNKRGLVSISTENEKLELERRAYEIRRSNNMMDDKTDYRGYKSELLGFSKGGISTSTGLAMLHGTPSKPEYILNTNQFGNLVNNLTSGVGLNRSGSSKMGSVNNNNLVINIYGDADSNSANKVRQAGKSILSEIKKTLNRNGTYR